MMATWKGTANRGLPLKMKWSTVQVTAPQTSYVTDFSYHIRHTCAILKLLDETCISHSNYPIAIYWMVGNPSI